MTKTEHFHSSKSRFDVNQSIFDNARKTIIVLLFILNDLVFWP